jgi:signal transduction histidine kinase
MQTKRDTDTLLRSFLDVGLHLTQELDIARVLQVIVERTMELTGARYGAAATVGPQGIEDFLYRGLTDEEVAALPHLPEGRGLLGAVIDSMEPVRCERLADHPASVGFPNDHVPMEAFLGVPMLLRGQLVGALYLTKSPGSAPFTADDEETVVAMASMAAVGVSNARLLAIETERAERVATLRDIASEVRDSLDVSSVLETTVHALGKASGADRCFIRLADESGQNDLGPMGYEWVAEGVPSLKEDAEIQYPVSSLAARTMNTHASVNILADPSLDDPSLPPKSNLEVMIGTGAALSTPLEWGGSLLGVVTLHSLFPRQWSESDIALIEAAAREVSIALHHANLYSSAVETAKRFQELDQLRSDFLSMVSHELRSPMTVVAGIAHLLRWRGDRLNPNEKDELLVSLEREARRLGRLVSEFLDMEAIDHGRIFLNREPIDVRELAAEAAMDAGHSTRTKIMSEKGDPVVRLDADRVKQVMLNLLTNAAKYSAENEPVTVNIVPAEQEVVVSVSDRGPGIPEDEMSHLFERFVRLSPAVKRVPGSGVGLYVSRMIVELHGGHIWAENQPGRGAKFSFTLPR